jgi:hypothetical protein
MLDSITRSDFFEGPEPAVIVEDKELGGYVHYRKRLSFIACFEVYINAQSR